MKSAGIRWPGRYDDLPLIGVSSLAKGDGPDVRLHARAMRRVLMDHDPLFARVEIVKSPMKGRMIAFRVTRAEAAVPRAVCLTQIVPFRGVSSLRGVRQRASDRSGSESEGLERATVEPRETEQSGSGTVSERSRTRRGRVLRSQRRSPEVKGRAAADRRTSPRSLVEPVTAPPSPAPRRASRRGRPPAIASADSAAATIASSFELRHEAVDAASQNYAVADGVGADDERAERHAFERREIEAPLGRERQEESRPRSSEEARGTRSLGTRNSRARRPFPLREPRRHGLSERRLLAPRRRADRCRATPPPARPPR